MSELRPKSSDPRYSDLSCLRTRMSNPPASFATYLEQVRRVTWQRLSARALVTWIGVSLALIAAGGLYSAWSGRGDLARTLCVAGMALAAWVCASERWTSLGRKKPTLDSCASAIAQVDDPPRATLRQDIVAAWSLSSQTKASGSPALRELYLHRVQGRLSDLPATEALPVPSSRGVWATLLIASTLCLVGVVLWPSAFASLGLGQDARPPLAPQVFWRSLGLHLTFPAKVQRSPKHLEPVAGQLSLPIGTRLKLEVQMPPNERFSSLFLRDRDASLSIELTPTARLEGRQRFEGTLEVKKPLQLELVGVDKESSAHRPKHGAAFSIAAIPDKAPQVELAPGPKTQRSDREGRLAVAIDARDDFGLRELSLHYQSPGQPAASVPIEFEGQPKKYRDTFIWNLSSIPVEQRTDLVYWIEARDNDSKINPKDNRPGNTSKTSPRTLIVDDARARHQQNLRHLAALRDEAVDLLALYMAPTVPGLSSGGLHTRLDHARRVQERSAQFLSNLARLIAALGQDQHAARSTRRVLTQIQNASQARHELAAPILRFIYANQRKRPGTQPLLSTPWPEENAPKFPSAVHLNSERLADALHEWTKLTPATIAQLEDDTLRLDDLVDAELMDQLEALMATLKKAQKKLVRWLDTLDMSNPKSKTRVEQLQSRIDLDMQRIQELQALLRDEVDPGFFNQDALAELAARMKHQSLKDKLKQGDLDGAKQAAKSQLSQMESVQQELQEQASPPKHLSPKEKAQRYLRRQLAQLKDEQADLLEQTPPSTQPWPHPPEKDAQFAKEIKKRLAKVKDTELNQPARKALQAAHDALEVLERQDAPPSDRSLAIEELRYQLKEAQRGAPRSQRGPLSKLLDQSEARADALPAQPTPQHNERREVQNTLLNKLDALGKAPEGQAGMTPELDRHLRDATSSMKDSAQSLGTGRSTRSRLAQSGAQAKLQSALDELNQAPPPPPPAGGEQVSMQAQQDKTLREAVLEALEKDSDSLSPSARAYYESLLEP